MGNLYVYVCAEADAQQLSSCGKPLEAGSISRSRVGLKLNSYLAGVLPCDPTLRNAPLWANLGTENGPDFWTNHIADGEHTRRNHSREEVGIIALNMSSVYEFLHKTQCRKNCWKIRCRKPHVLLYEIVGPRKQNFIHSIEYSRLCRISYTKRIVGKSVGKKCNGNLVFCCTKLTHLKHCRKVVGKKSCQSIGI